MILLEAGGNSAKVSNACLDTFLYPQKMQKSMQFITFYRDLGSELRFSNCLGIVIYTHTHTKYNIYNIYIYIYIYSQTSIFINYMIFHDIKYKYIMQTRTPTSNIQV